MSKYHVLLIALFNAAVLSFYGIEVCPFLESLSAITLFTIIFSHFIAAWLIRTIILSKKNYGPHDENYPKIILHLDFSIWTSVGFFITFWNNYFYQFPVESGLKVVLGCLTLGFYSSMYIYLKQQYVLLRYQIKRSKKIELVKKESFISITQKYFIFFVITIMFTTSVLLLLIYKDFEFVIDVITAGKPFMFRWIVQEILFVFVLLLFGAILLTRQYGKNLRLLFSAQLHVLSKVENGDLEAFIPAITQDELGIIARHTNKMVDGLREKRKIKETFGKYIDATLAKKILETSSDHADLGGREIKTCIVFSDIRNFTTISEQTSPATLVKLLNEYFSLIVKIIHRHGGILDKFIGDASMSVFGAEQGPDINSRALQAAIEIDDELGKFNHKLKSQGHPALKTGIGIHAGSVIAGNIGSQERMEYTFIGDTVNTASRIEHKTKDLNSPILLSEDVYQGLTQALRDRVIPCGVHSIRGKTNNLALYKPI